MTHHSRPWQKESLLLWGFPPEEKRFLKKYNTRPWGKAEEFMIPSPHHVRASDVEVLASKSLMFTAHFQPVGMRLYHEERDGRVRYRSHWGGKGLNVMQQYIDATIHPSIICSDPAPSSPVPGAGPPTNYLAHRMDYNRSPQVKIDGCVMLRMPSIKLHSRYEFPAFPVFQRLGEWKIDLVKPVVENVPQTCRVASALDPEARGGCFCMKPL